MNHYDANKENRQGILILAAKEHGMGIMMMKAIRSKETIQGLYAQNLVRYALSLEGPNGIAVGMKSKKVVDSNLDLLRNFKPMGSDEMVKFAMILAPYSETKTSSGCGKITATGIGVELNCLFDPLFDLLPDLFK